MVTHLHISHCLGTVLGDMTESLFTPEPGPYQILSHNVIPYPKLDGEPWYIVSLLKHSLTNELEVHASKRNVDDSTETLMYVGTEAIEAFLSELNAELHLGLTLAMLGASSNMNEALIPRHGSGEY